MLNLFQPKCPVDHDAKDWIEQRFTWLTTEFGIRRLTTGRIILPTEEFLPLEYACTEEGIGQLMVRVADYMDVDPARLKLNFYENKSPQPELAVNERSAKLYAENQDHFDIWLEVNSLHDPAGTLATLAHEIGKVLLLGQRRVTPSDEDHAELADLLTVFLGLGIFQANSVIHETNWTGVGWAGWSVARRGCLSMNMFGYALALYTLARGEPKPAWAAYLRPDAKAYLQRGINYISKTSDCLYRPAIQRGA